MPTFDLLVRNSSEILCVQGEQRQTPAESLSPIARGAVGALGGHVVYLGPESQLPRDAIGPQTEVIDANGGFVGPGFVDCHTHLVFAGDRSSDFEQRCCGTSTAEIIAAGGGIMSTVRATRSADEDSLVGLAIPRLYRLLHQGVTAAEVKSGYGLTATDELKLLRAIQRLAREQPITLVPTLLAGHAIPTEMSGDRGSFVKACVEEIVPAAARAGLAKFCDVFVETIALTISEARRILGAGRAHGLYPRLHADQLSDGGGALLAAEMSAASADHLENVSAEGIAALAKAAVPAVIMPLTTLFLRQARYAPGRALVEAGVSVAIATNVNPGSAMSENVAVSLGLACIENGLSAAQAYWGLTRGGAAVLRLPEYGRLFVGGPADLVVFACKTYRHLPYHFGVNHAHTVIKRGRVAWRNPTWEKTACS